MHYNSSTSFGYPVLRPITPGDNVEMMDYPQKTFEPILKVLIAADKRHVISIDYEIGLRVAELSDLITAGIAEFRIEINCSSTFFRKSLPISKEKGIIELDANLLRGNIEYMVYLIAKKDFKFSPTSAHADYQGLNFSILKDQVLAISAPQESFIDKDLFKTMKALFETSAADDVAEGEFRLLTTQDYVNIQLNPKTLKTIQIAQNNSKKQSVIIASLFVPVITQLLQDLKDDEPEKNSVFKWQQIIYQKLREKNMNLKQEALIPNYAQRLWNMPLKELSEREFGI